MRRDFERIFEVNIKLNNSTAYLSFDPSSQNLWKVPADSYGIHSRERSLFCAVFR